MIDGNRNGRYVLFDHDAHIERVKESGGTCVKCHHMRMPFDKATSCFKCHSDMYLPKSIFDHSFHARKLGGNSHCSECHTDPALPKTMENTKDCLSCHEGMCPEGSFVKAKEGRRPYLAAGYMKAMHGLCIGCHEEAQKTLKKPHADLTICTNCHRFLPGLDSKVWDDQR